MGELMVSWEHILIEDNPLAPFIRAKAKHVMSAAEEGTLHQLEALLHELSVTIEHAKQLPANPSEWPKNV